MAQCKTIFVRFALRDVAENDGNAAKRRGFDAECIDLVPAPHRDRRHLGAPWLAGLGDAAIHLVPVSVMIGLKFTHSSPDGILDAGVGLERGVDDQEAVVEGATIAIMDDLNDAYALIDCVEQGAG